MKTLILYLKHLKTETDFKQLKNKYSRDLKESFLDTVDAVGTALTHCAAFFCVLTMPLWFLVYAYFVFRKTLREERE
jgi:hypothetical protein